MQEGMQVLEFLTLDRALAWLLASSIRSLILPPLQNHILIVKERCLCITSFHSQCQKLNLLQQSIFSAEDSKTVQG